jgi:hypothetical protein
MACSKILVNLLLGPITPPLGNKYTGESFRNMNNSTNILQNWKPFQTCLWRPGEIV